jgi:hypothetical protein
MESFSQRIPRVTVIRTLKAPMPQKNSFDPANPLRYGSVDSCIRFRMPYSSRLPFLETAASLLESWLRLLYFKRLIN